MNPLSTTPISSQPQKGGGGGGGGSGRFFFAACLAAQPVGRSVGRRRSGERASATWIIETLYHRMAAPTAHRPSELKNAKVLQGNTYVHMDWNSSLQYIAIFLFPFSPWSSMLYVVVRPAGRVTDLDTERYIESKASSPVTVCLPACLPTSILISIEPQARSSAGSDRASWGQASALVRQRGLKLFPLSDCCCCMGATDEKRV